ncbi:MAG: hypothetical protein GZ089_06050 [Aromatoleum sp.]|nr:hypothetical protein [Aromatoleum sp.]
MSLVPLRIGALSASGFTVQRSGLRWLCEDGQLCRPGEVIAYCNVGLTPEGPRPSGVQPFADEARDFQIAFATRVGGRLHRSPESSLGGFLDQLVYYQLWTPDFVIGHIQCRPSERPPGYDADGETVRLLMLAGRRVTEIAEVRSGLNTGWHDRSRAWWGGDEVPFGTLLCLGICEQAGVIRGEKHAFLEMFDAVPGPAQIVYYPDNVLVPSSSLLAGQLVRTAAAASEIAIDFSRSFAAGSVVPTPGEWVFAGALMSALMRSPFAEPYDVLTRSGLRRVEASDAVLLSLNAEAAVVRRHRRLGYTLHCHDFRVAEAGPAVKAWLRTEFEKVRRTPDDIRRDYCQLIDAVRARSETQFLVLNVISTSGHENVHCYAPFDRPLGDTLRSVRARELNVMLHDLARERNVAIVDVDAIAADLGTERHAPDSVHCSGPLQNEIRREILRLLRDLGVSGFAATAVR